MVELRFRVAFELSDDLLREHLAQLDTPLVEGVDVPDDALGEDGVLVECDQLAEGFGCEDFGEDGIRRAIAFENLVRDEGVGRAADLDLRSSGIGGGRR